MKIEIKLCISIFKFFQVFLCGWVKNLKTYGPYLICKCTRKIQVPISYFFIRTTLSCCSTFRGAGTFSRDFTTNLSPQSRVLCGALKTENIWNYGALKWKIIEFELCVCSVTWKPNNVSCRKFIALFTSATMCRTQKS